MENSFLTVEELSKLLKVPKSWIYQRTRLGEIPYIRLGKRHIRFDPEEVVRRYKGKNIQ